MVEFASGTLFVTSMGFTIALMLTFAARRYRSRDDEVVELINRELPQTQCAQCGYPGCRPYAEAVVNGEAMNKCPPGGEETIARLADLLGRPAGPLDPALDAPQGDRVAFIAEEDCIGCTLCLPACPVDAIIGAPQMMHTVIQSECTGCDLCVEPCPVDCIDMVQRPAPPDPEAVPVPAEGGMPCIHCDHCETVCPCGLQPQLLHWYLDSPRKLQVLDLNACIECARCDHVCPSRIPLAARFHNAKLDMARRTRETARAAHHEARYLRKQARAQREAGRVKRRPEKKDRAAIIGAIKREVAS